jgi:hypothetical protein
MNNLNPSRKLAARPRAGRFLALFMLFGMPRALILALLMLVLAGGTTASAQVVTNSADNGPGTLRSAITNAASGAVITFDPSLSGATITLSNTLTINTNLTIDASALSGGLQINGNGSVIIFNVAFNITVFLNSLTITNGYAGVVFGIGGTATLNQCTLSGNSGLLGGGIHFGGGLLTLNQCTLSGNSADAGGGIFIMNGTLVLNQCTLSGNSATNDGGGIWNHSGIITLNQCTLSGNSAINGGGGGINNYYDGTVALNQCTLSGNSATNVVDIGGGFGGGGIYNGGRLAMTNCILSGNSDNYGADDIYNDSVLTYGGSNLILSVVYVSPNYYTGPAPLTNAPDLAPLGNYGGPTQTMPPLPGSPAIGAGSVAANTFSTDQRGYPRTQNGLIDLGAVELQPPAASPPVLENITVPAGGGNGLHFTFTNAPAADFTVLTATNVSLALTNWTVLGEVRQVAPGQYQFTDPQASTNTARFYRVRSP